MTSRERLSEAGPCVDMHQMIDQISRLNLLRGKKDGKKSTGGATYYEWKLAMHDGGVGGRAVAGTAGRKVRVCSIWESSGE